MRLDHLLSKEHMEPLGFVDWSGHHRMCDAGCSWVEHLMKCLRVVRMGLSTPGDWWERCCVCWVWVLGAYYWVLEDQPAHASSGVWVDWVS